MNFKTKSLIPVVLGLLLSSMVWSTNNTNKYMKVELHSTSMNKNMTLLVRPEELKDLVGTCPGLQVVKKPAGTKSVVDFDNVLKASSM